MTLIEPWLNMRRAPRDGTIIRIAVKGFQAGEWHELPYFVRFYSGRWCYARYNTRMIFPWHEPMGWKSAVVVRDAA